MVELVYKFDEKSYRERLKIYICVDTNTDHFTLLVLCERDKRRNTVLEIVHNISSQSEQDKMHRGLCFAITL